MEADSANAIFELDQTSKFGSSPILISSKPADLAVTAASAPATAARGTAVLVNWTVANQGIGDTAVTAWQDNVYADTSSTLDNQAILLGSFTHVGLLNPGDSYTQSQLVTLPIAFSGDCYLFVVTNEPYKGSPIQPVYESNTANDVSNAVPITISDEVADLQVISVTAPLAALTGSDVTIDWTVENSGTGLTNSNYWYDDVWLSTNSTLQSGGNDIYLGGLQHTNPLAAGDSYAASLTVALPDDLPAGNYYFIVATDRPLLPKNTYLANENLVYESNENNNETAATPSTSVTLAAVPDLAVSDISVPPTAFSGQTLTVGWTVTNNGADTGNVQIGDSVYLSLDQVLSNNDRYLGTVTEGGGLAAGADYTQSATFQLPAGAAGTYYVFVVTDSTNTVYERDTADSTAYNPTPVEIQLPPPSDLVAGTVVIPANAVPGQDITIGYEVTNNGANPAEGAGTMRSTCLRRRPGASATRCSAGSMSSGKSPPTAARTQTV